jgi:hypothetical protein
MFGKFISKYTSQVWAHPTYINMSRVITNHINNLENRILY